MTKPCSSEVRKSVLEYFETRFGITSSKLGSFELYDAGNQKVYLGPKNYLGEPKMVSAGILAIRYGPPHKPSTNFFQSLGHLFERNAVTLDETNVKAFLAGEDIKISEKEINGSTDGYVIVRYQKFNLGCAHLSNNLLKNQIPKSKMLEVNYI